MLNHRWAAQLLNRPDGLDAGEIVRHLLAVQAQDVTAALLAFRARSASLGAGDVLAAWHGREIVRTWGPRGTLHFVHVEDLPWLLALTGRIGLAGSLRRLAQEGVKGDDLLKLIDYALAGQGPLTKAELRTRLAGRADGQGIVHLVDLAAAHGLALLGPPRGGKPTYVHAADWLGAPIAFEPDRDRALAELARRYLRAHAPATAADLAAWTRLPLGDARTALRLIADDLDESPDGTVRLRTAPTERKPPTVRLAPAFDEYLLGWADRTPILDEPHRREVLPGGGILRPVVLSGGVIKGTWSRKGTSASVHLFEPVDQNQIEAETADVSRFLTS